MRNGRDPHARSRSSGHLVTAPDDDAADGGPGQTFDGAPIEVYRDSMQWHIRRDGIRLGTFPTRAAAAASATKVAAELGVSATTA